MVFTKWSTSVSLFWSPSMITNPVYVDNKEDRMMYFTHSGNSGWTEIICSFLCPEKVLNAQAIPGLLTEHNTHCSGASLSKLSSSATWFLLTWSGDGACLNWALELLCRTFERATCRGTTTDRLPLPPSSTCPLQNFPDLQDWRVFLPPEPLWTCLMLLESQHWVLLIIYYFIPCA